MSDYISREAAIKALRELRKEFPVEEDENKAFNLGLMQGIIFASKEIKSIPAADVREVTRGKWKIGAYTDVAPISIEFYYCSEYFHRLQTPRTNFCPNCGADMRQP